MKKAKIVLSAVAVLAVVGGAFAFKASRIPNVLYYAPNSTSPCTNRTVTFLKTTNVGSAITYYSTQSVTLPPSATALCHTFTQVTE